MSFLEVAFLLGSLAVAGPILAHFFARPRHRRIRFTMLRFLQVGQAEIESRRKLRDLLLLLLRCSIIILLALLFAGPRLLTTMDGGDHNTERYIAVDNSLSMSYKERGATLFNRLKDKTRAYIRSLPENDIFHIYPLASGNPFKNLSRTQAIAYVSSLRLEPLSADLHTFLSALSGTSKKDKTSNKISAFMASDFSPQIIQQFSGILPSIALDDFQYEIIAPQDAIDNQFITEGHVENAEEGYLQTQATIVNNAREPTTRTYVIRDERQALFTQEVELEPQERQVIRERIPIDSDNTTTRPLEFALLESDGLKADDTYYLGVSIPQRSHTRVLLVGQNRAQIFLLQTAIQTLARHNPSEGITVEQTQGSKLNDLNVLNSTDFIIFASVFDFIESTPDLIESLKLYLNQGGRIAFFVSPNQNQNLLETFWGEGMLPALPYTLRKDSTHIVGSPEIPISAHLEVLSAKAAHALKNYQIDRVPCSGYFDCEAHSTGICLWRLQNGAGFIYYAPYGSGYTFLINTSADDSMGGLLKAPASVAFCRYLLGQKHPIQIFDYVCGERFTLPRSKSEQKGGKREMRIELLSPTGKRIDASLTDLAIIADAPHEIGWVKTQSSPLRYAGINPPKEETYLKAPDDESIHNLITSVIQPAPKIALASALPDQRSHRPIWKEIGWILIGFILAEALLANRIKR